MSFCLSVTFHHENRFFFFCLSSFYLWPYHVFSFLFLRFNRNPLLLFLSLLLCFSFHLSVWLSVYLLSLWSFHFSSCCKNNIFKLSFILLSFFIFSLCLFVFLSIFLYPFVIFSFRSLCLFVFLSISLYPFVIFSFLSLCLLVYLSIFLYPCVIC
jgi:hypothetical protein